MQYTDLTRKELQREYSRLTRKYTDFIRQPVDTRRRHKKGVTAGKSRPSETAKKNCKGYYGLPRVLRTLAMTLLNVSK